MISLDKLLPPRYAEDTPPQGGVSHLLRSEKQKFDITGMTCSACSAHVEKAVNKLEGVRKAEVSLMTNSMNVEYDEAALAPESIIQAVVPGRIRRLPARPGWGPGPGSR